MSQSVLAAGVQLAGLFLLVPLLPSSRLWLLVLAGFYVWSFLSLAIGEWAVGAAPSRRTMAVAIVTAAGLLWIGSMSVRTDRSPVTSWVVASFGLNLLASLWLGRSGHLATTETPSGTPSPEWGKAARYVARVVAALAAVFVCWQVIVESVRVQYFVEARIIGDLRTMISAEEAYASENFGFYDTPGCLQSPGECLPGYAERGFTPFLGSEPWLGTVRYYRRRFVPGVPVDPAELPANASRTSVKTYAYVAVPAEPDGIRGLVWRWAGLSLGSVRAFCGDSTGRICSTDGREEPRVAGGVCASECRAIP